MRIKNVNDTPIARIAKSLLHGSSGEGHVKFPISLLSGPPGITVFFSILNEIAPDERWQEKIFHDYEQAFRLVGSYRGEVLPTFCDGIAGIGWLSLFLKNSGFLDFESDVFLEDIDSYLQDSLARLIAEGNWDPLHGAIGIGLYFVKRGNLAAVTSLLDFLEQTAEIDEHTVKWRRYESYYSKNLYDLGLAHGIAGIAVFLIKCCAYPQVYDRCKLLLENILAFYLLNAHDHHVHGSHFCNFIYCDDDKRSHVPSFSKLAWCYGDLGIGNTLFNAATVLRDSAMQEKALQLLRKSAERLTFAETGIDNIGFCHGSSGAGLIFTRLFALTGEYPFAAAAQHWKNVTLHFLDHPPDTQRQQYDLLTGSAGAGLFLLANDHQEICRNGYNDWMEAFLLT